MQNRLSQRFHVPSSPSPLPLVRVCLCVTSIPQQSVRLLGRVSLSNPSGGIWFVLLELFHSKTEVTLKERVSPLLSKALFGSLWPQQHLSQPPWWLADTPGVSNVTTKPSSWKVLVWSPCGSLSSSLTVLWFFLGKLFFWTSSFRLVYGKTAREKTELAKNRKKHWLARLTWLRLGVWKWLCVCVRVWVHSPMWFHLDLGREHHSYSSHPVSSL